MKGEESPREAEVLLLSYLQSEDRAESERLLAELLARAGSVIEKRLGRRLHVSIRGGRCPLSPEAEDQYGEATMLLIEKLRRLKTAGSRQESIRDFQSYVAGIAENAFRNRLRADYRQLRSLKDALRYLLDGRTRHKVFALWRCENGKQAGGLAEWRGSGTASGAERGLSAIAGRSAHLRPRKTPAGRHPRDGPNGNWWWRFSVGWVARSSSTIWSK